MVAGIAIDITEWKQADARKNEFLAMLAHELRNPGNLLSNACKYTGRGGHIWLTVEPVDSASNASNVT